MKTLLKFNEKWLERPKGSVEAQPDVYAAPGGFWRVEEPLETGGVRVSKIRWSHTGKQFSMRTSDRLEFHEKSERSSGGEDRGAGDADLVAQFPGKVLKILVQIGDTVTQGQPLLLVEAMKMEFAVKAPRDGTVSALGAQTGDVISPGLKLVEIE